jgi:hypothetical protein
MCGGDELLFGMTVLHETSSGKQSESGNGHGFPSLVSAIGLQKLYLPMKCKR